MLFLNDINWYCFPLEQFDIVFYAFYVLSSILVLIILKKKDNVLLDYFLLQVGLNAYFLLFVYYLVHIGNIYIITIVGSFIISFNFFLIFFAFLHVIFFYSFNSLKLFIWLLLLFFHRLYMFLIYKVSTFTLYINSSIYDSFSSIIVERPYFSLKIIPSDSIIKEAISNCVHENLIFALQVAADPSILKQLSDFLAINDCSIANLVFHLYNYQDAIPLVEQKTFITFNTLIMSGLFLGCLLGTGLFFLLSYLGVLPKNITNQDSTPVNTIDNYDVIFVSASNIYDLTLVALSIIKVYWLQLGFDPAIVNDLFNIEEQEAKRIYRKTLMDAHPDPDELKAFFQWWDNHEVISNKSTLSPKNYRKKFLNVII